MDNKDDNKKFIRALHLEAKAKLCTFLIEVLDVPFYYGEAADDLVLDPNNTSDDQVQCESVFDWLHNSESCTIIEHPGMGMGFELKHGPEDVYYELIDRGNGKCDIRTHFKDL